MARLTIPVTARDHLQGNLRAPVILLEYGDYECPFCGAAHPIVKAIQEHMGSQLCFAFRNFPLAQMHPHALLAAYAAEAAGLQKAFWEMHDILFTHQDALEDDDLVDYAAMIGLNMQRFAVDFASEYVQRRVRQDFMSGVRSGVNGTPTFFINGRRYNGSYEYERLLAAIRRAAKAEEALL
jgi:protein-disulfide isomerase